MSEKWTKWLWLVFLPGGPIIIVIVVQLIANTPLNTPLSISSLNDIHFSLSSDLRGLLLRDDLFDSNWAWLEQRDMPLRTRITLTNKRVVELGLFRISQLIPETDQELQEKLDKIRDLLYRLGITTGIYDVFFWICAYAFYRRQFIYIMSYAVDALRGFVTLEYGGCKPPTSQLRLTSAS